MKWGEMKVKLNEEVSDDTEIGHIFYDGERTVAPTVDAKTREVEIYGVDRDER